MNGGIKQGVVRALAVAALLGLLLASCGVFETKAQRNQRAYERYVEKSMQEREKRRRLIAKEKVAEANRLAAEARAEADTALE